VARPSVTSQSRECSATRLGEPLGLRTAKAAAVGTNPNGAARRPYHVVHYERPVAYGDAEPGAALGHVGVVLKASFQGVGLQGNAGVRLPLGPGLWIAQRTEPQLRLKWASHIVCLQEGGRDHGATELIQKRRGLEGLFGRGHHADGQIDCVALDVARVGRFANSHLHRWMGGVEPWEAGYQPLHRQASVAGDAEARLPRARRLRRGGFKRAEDGRELVRQFQSRILERQPVLRCAHQGKAERGFTVANLPADRAVDHKSRTSGCFAATIIWTLVLIGLFCATTPWVHTSAAIRTAPIGSYPRWRSPIRASPGGSLR
jgi:hypothetical protein